MNLNLYFLVMYSFIVTGALRWGIIIATSATQVLPNHTNLLPLMLNQPFCSESKKGISSIWQRKLSQSHIRVKKSIVSTIIFVRNPSLEDDSDEPRNLKLSNSPRYETKATNSDITHCNITFYKKIGLFLYLDNLEQTVASYRGQTKVKFLRDTLISNLRNMRNTQEIHDTNHFKWFVNSSDKINYIKIIKYTFSMIIFFREMSNKPVPMEVEEAGIDDYMLDFQGMLDRLDSPSEVQGEGVGDCAGGDLVVRESGVMGREGGAEGGDAEPLPVSCRALLQAGNGQT